MIKRSPQEIADFFGCYVAQDEGDAGRYFHAFSERPTLTTDEDFRIRNVWCTPGKPDCVSWFISIECVEVPEGHDYHILYEPRMQKPEKPDHASEVYIHKEYVVAEGNRIQDLSKKVNTLLSHGWKLQGGVAIEHFPESDGYKEGSAVFYQAMVRGL